MLLALLLGTVAAFISTAPATAALTDIPTPAVAGPIPVTQTSYPFLATDIDLSKYGYVEKEYTISGMASRYDLTAPFTQTATRITTGGGANDGYFPFKTRIVVRRPADPSKANGSVLAEWYNVTALQDIEWNWFGDPYYMLKNGYTFVGISAQTAGVTALKAFNNARYGDLTVNGNGAVIAPPDNDALSYDIYGSALKSLVGGGSGADPMGGINATTLIASGESQSCSRLSSYYNKVQPIHGLADAFLLNVCTSTLRTDRPEKAIRIISESENRTPRPEATLPDTASLRHWEVAGGSHLPRIAFDNVNPTLTRDFGAAPVARCKKFPLSLVAWPYTQNRAIDALVKWANGGTAPPIAPRGQYINNPAYDPMLPTNYTTNPATNPPQLLDRDQYGIAKGGIRYPEMDVPVGVNDGINQIAPDAPLPFSLFCGLFGSTTQFSSEQLHTVYFDFADYVNKYATAADAMVSTGFILPEDVVRLKASSRQFAELRPSSPSTIGRKANKGSFGLTWLGTEAPDTTFQIQRGKNSDGSGYKDVKATIDGATASLKNEPQGTFRYRVRNTTILPGTNISDPRTATTPYSAELTGVKVDRSGPKTPKLVVKGKRDKKAGKNVYKGVVKIRVIGKPDAKLPDGSAGVGLNPKSVPKTRKIKKRGRTVIKVTTKDKLGNRSKTKKLVIKIK